jgi:MSHA biogenesis protein MshQ
MRILFIIFMSLLFFAAQTFAAISFVASVTDRGNDDKASLVVPASTLLGDVLVAQVTFRNRNGSDGVTTPSGWNLLATQDRDSDVFQSVYYRIASAGDAGASYEWDFDGNGSRRYILGMSVFRGVDTTTPIADDNSATDGVFWGSLTAPSVTTTSANSMLVALYTMEAGNESFSPGVGMTESYDIEEHNGNDGITSMVAWELFPGVGATGSRVATASKNFDDGIGHLVALNEGATGPMVNSLVTSCANVDSIVLNFSADLEITSAENVSNYSVVNAASIPITISSATLSASDQVTLTLGNNLNDLTPYSVVINNVENLLGFPIEANSTEDFMLRCDANCITDNFVGPGPLSDSWSVGNSSGSFGDPLIVADGRLRLTDSSNSVATFATLLNQFPGAENRIEIEFDYYGYDGNGADGIAINVSDASILPVAGAAGGSLGYAQKTGVNGFAGGWLGVGIDEYGNFSNPSEGRVGGTSRVTDSVSLRGSGSGTSGYPYLTGTSSLSPGIDQSGSTPNPGHRYKVVIDHTASGNTALVTIERDTGSGYSVIIPEFDVFVANPSQAAVPANWVVSFTGSTGGSTNIHEIGDLKVCAAQPIQTFSIVDHYEISHISPGITCEASEVTITAHDINHDPINVLSDTSLSITTTPAISAIITSPVTLLTGTSSTTVYLQQGSVLANIDIDVSDGTFTDDEGSSEDPRISFVDAAFRFYADGNNIDTTPIETQISAKPSTEAPNVQSLELRAIQTNTDTGACEAALTGTQAVNIGYRCQNPDTCMSTQLLFSGDTNELVTGTDAAAALSYTAVDMVFDGTGSAPFSFSYPDAGIIELYAQLTVAEVSPEPEFTLTGVTNPFVVRPFAFDLGFSGDFNAVDADGTPFMAAGTPFPMTIRAVGWQATDDSNDDGLPDLLSNTANNSTALNFGQENSGSDQTLTIAHTLVLPTAASGGNSGNLTTTQVKTSSIESFFTAGITDGTPAVNAAWDEVGIIDINVSLNNYLSASGANILGRQDNVGRFYPDKYIMLAGNSMTNGCNGFSYMGQAVGLTYTLEAQNAGNIKTQNYHGDFVKMNPLNDLDLVAENANDAGSYQARLLGFGSTNWNRGEYSLGTTGNFSRAAVLDGPYQTLQVGLQVSDNDGDRTLLSGLDMNADENTNCGTVGNCDAKLIGVLDMRYGQLKLSNVFGPEAFNLDMTVNTEYFDGTSFILNTDDNSATCTSLQVNDPPFSAVAGSWTDNLADGDSTISLLSNITAGVGVIRFGAAGLGNEGSVIYQYDTDSWLKTENTGDASYDDNPQGKVTFGQYRGNDRMIYWREVVR